MGHYVTIFDKLFLPQGLALTVSGCALLSGSFFPGEVVRELKQHVHLIIGQIASPLPPESFIKGYDLILTSCPHFVDPLRQLGVKSEYLRIGFDESGDALDAALQSRTPEHGLARHDPKSAAGHGRLTLFQAAIKNGGIAEYLSERTAIRVFGYGAHTLPNLSPIRRRHEGEVWGMAMYQALARSRITLPITCDFLKQPAPVPCY
jgi:spore maturation protein CgeB